MKVYLIGVGLGSPETMTVAAQRAIEACPLLIGASRLLEPFPHKRRLPLIAAADIAAAIGREREGPVAVLLSGDVGFYSGARNLYPLLEGHQVVTLPGVSSLVYFCAKLRVPWQDVFLVSAHGRAHNAPGAVQSHEKTFILTGGSYGPGELCADLCRWGLGAVRVTVGERLSYEEEAITAGTAEELAGGTFDSLSVVLAENPAPIGRQWSAPGLPDSAFLRGKVPMTKEEVRALVLSKLRLEPHHTLWDVGAGTGSVSVEGALALPAGRVFAVERSEEALALLRENRARFGLTNLTVVAGAAPGALEPLPPPHRVFLGGTGGGMEAILEAVLRKNPAARVVCAAVTLETLTQALALFQEKGLGEVEILQAAVTRTRRVGPYHMMEANNPVWLLSGEGQP